MRLSLFDGILASIDVADNPASERPSCSIGCGDPRSPSMLSEQLYEIGENLTLYPDINFRYIEALVD